MDTQPSRPAAPQTTKVIGRWDEQDAIRRAIVDTKTCALHFVGVAGIGKTRQLREVDKWHAAQKEGRSEIPQSFEWLGLIDLYHSDLHTPSIVERQIIARIDPIFETNRDGSPFKTYLQKRVAFEEHRRQGLASEQERAELTLAFVNDYNDWVVGHRAVIAFDTLELIVYEQDQVLKTCEGEAGSADVKGWLLEVLPQLKNTVILLGSRSPTRLEDEFKDRFASMQVCYERFELRTLNEEDALDYLKDICAQRPDITEALKEPGREPTDIYHEIWRYTQGVPILMGMVIQLAAFGQRALGELRRREPGGLDWVKKLLVEELKEITPPIWNTLQCLAVARKGLTPELFQRLMATEGWELAKCQEELDRLRGTVFIKSREGTPALFLHDALYEMFDAYKPYPLIDPGRQLPIIIGYYQEQINARDKNLEVQRRNLRELDLRGRVGLAPDVAALRQILLTEITQEERVRRQLQVEQVFYELWRDPQAGFDLYAQLYNEALKAHNFGFDARLHDEILRYLNGTLYTENPQAQKRLPRYRFERHCALRWVKIHLARGGREGHERTVRVAKRIMKTAKPPLGGDEAKADLLYQAELRLCKGEALLYLGRTQEAERWLQESLELLRRVHPKADYARWRYNRLTGRAHNDLGYIYKEWQQYSNSVREYRKAVAQFRAADIREEMADTLNNLAYVYSIRRETSQAKALIEDARELREQSGRNYLLALSYNTTAEIYTASGEPEEALYWCGQARAIFASIESDRGKGLNLIASGRANRMLGDKGKRGQTPFDQAQEAFRAAEESLNKAIKVFGGDEPSVNEPLRYWEALNELGSTYVDWAYLLVWHGLQDLADEKYKLAVKYQEQAAQFAKSADLALQLLDSYDDLAQAFADWGQLDLAQDYLGRVYRAVPKEYRLVESVGFKKLPAPVDGYWFIMGKYYRQRGIWAHTKAERAETPSEKDKFLDEAARHFAMAVAYFQQFTPAQDYVDESSRAMYRRFKTLKPERLERLRRDVQKAARQYRIKLSRLLDTLDDTLGLPSV